MFKKILTYLTLGTICSLMIGIPIAKANLGGAFSGGGLTSTIADTLYCKLTGCSMTGQLNLDGAASTTAISVRNAASQWATFGTAGTQQIGLFANAQGAGNLTLLNCDGTSGCIQLRSTPGITTISGINLQLTPTGTGQVVITGGTPVNINGDILHMNAPTSITSGTCTAEALNTGATEFKGIVTATCTAQTWIVVFTTTYTRAPTCVVIPLNAAAVADVGTVYATTTTTLTATVTTATTNGTWAYQCVE